LFHYSYLIPGFWGGNPINFWGKKGGLLGPLGSFGVGEELKVFGSNKLRR